MTASTHTKERILSVDSVRGLIILLMILEHSRYGLSEILIWEFPGASSVIDLSTGGAMIHFFSHLCAPGFFFILGISVIPASLNKPEGMILGKTIKRGLFLMGLQLTVVNFGWALPHLLRGNISFAEKQPLYFGVLFSLGFAYIIACFVARFSGVLIGFLFAGIVGMCFYSDYSGGHSENLLTGLFITGIRDRNFEVPFPLLPWLAVTLSGVIYARLFFKPWYGKERNLLNQAPLFTLLNVIFLMMGITASVILVRYPGIFYKYPPSLLFLLINLLIIASLMGLFNAVAFLNISWLRTIGRHPLLIYVLHLYLIGFAAVFFHGDYLIQSAGVAGVVTAGCIAAAGLYESDLFAGPRLNVFNLYHRVYDHFMLLFSLYQPEEIRRSLFPDSQDLQTTIGQSGDRQSDGRLLDIAGGTGYIAKQLREYFRTIAILDFSLPMLSVAKKRGLSGCRGTALSLPFASDTFSAIICTEALHHIKDAEASVREMRRVLTSGGRVVIQEFHIKGLSGFILFAFERLFIDDSQFITPEELESLMTEYGFYGTTRPISRIGYLYEGYLLRKES